VLENAPISAADKSFPAATWGWDLSVFRAATLYLTEFQTPLLTLDQGRIASNVAVMASWCSTFGFDIAPHGKTTMAPTLWQQQLDAGAWAITLATPWQVQVARAAGIQRIVLANALVDPVALRWVADELDAHPDFEFCSWVDSIETVQLMTATLGGRVRGRPVSVIVELGAAEGRTGTRSVEQAIAVAEAVDASPALVLGGCGGYEGAVGHDRTDQSIARVRDYLQALTQLHRELQRRDLYDDGDSAVVTVGGSAYLDLVASTLAPIVDSSTRVVIRAGAYIVHDDGFYRSISPLDAGRIDGERFGGGLRSAMHAWLRVVSRPEPTLAILDGGKRDLPVDEGLPEAQRVLGASAPTSGLLDARVTAVNDQHLFLRLGPAADPLSLPVGSVVRFGLSHPCTALDKWRAIPVVDDADAAEPAVTDVIRTWF
jgi:D-serine deaminase-like pyridoxal phosphate-dependent protein